MNNNNVDTQYNSMSYFYDVLYSGYNMKDWEDDFINEFKDLLDILDENAKVLDSSCGNGVQATALKRYGIDVVGTDISEEMINLTQKYAESNNLSFPTKRLSWADLPNNFGEDFDLVFCYGNSICHSIDKEDMLNNIKSLYKVTKHGGKIIMDTRNWDKVLRDNIRFNGSGVQKHLDKIYAYTYIWNLKDFEERSNVEIVFIDITNEKSTKCIPFRLDFTPFKHDEFISRLKACGLKVLKDTFQLDNDNYSIILQK
ncbi:class I SAM-dependent methyltransferase [Clostridium sp. C8-1-8]|uniref:class I SAM-dependent methyltransferase n=1 Tax=Clostridium sp. C8-1-8 TaxID=2698831 RepID=UPI00136886B8|nr:class I SAM-dependent methyltransferase [Clostridium sp. C8-1-8]